MTRQAAILSFLTFILVSGCNSNSRKSGSSSPPVQVTTARVVKIPFQEEIILSGNVEGDRTIRLGFLVAGKINFIAAKEGESVSRNTLLASLDPSNYEIARELADIQANQVQDEYDRLKLMHDNNSLSESDFAKISFGLQQARAQQKLHSKNLADTRLFSPIDGILLKKLAEVGEITGTGIPLFVVSDIRKIKVNAFVPENELHKIRIGDSARVIVSSLDKSYTGVITELGSAADPASRSFSLKIEVKNPELLIRPGMIAEVKIISRTKDNFIAVPSVALQHDYNDLTYVFVADASKSIAFRRNIIPGMIKESNVEVLSGLNEGELVVTAGQQRLVDGSAITLER